MDQQCIAIVKHDIKCLSCLLLAWICAYIITDQLLLLLCSF